MRNTNKPIFSAGIPWPFMMVIQVHHPWWEGIVVIQFLPAMSLQAMRSWLILKQTILIATIMDSKWNTIQQVSKTHQFKIKLNIIYAKFSRKGPRKPKANILHINFPCQILLYALFIKLILYKKNKVQLSNQVLWG